MFDDKHCRQLIVLTVIKLLDGFLIFQTLDIQAVLMLSLGPILATGNELAEAASQALGTEMKFEDISKYI
jgi:hypothetical protein